LKLKTFLTVLLIMVGLAAAVAEEKYGVKVYDGARYDADTSAFVSQMAGEAACYRTPDDAGKVVALYKGQPGAQVLSSSAKGGMLKIGGINVTVQRPWRDMKSGKLNEDTLISIVKPK
jgi:hypothetical protein